MRRASRAVSTLQNPKCKLSHRHCSSQTAHSVHEHPHARLRGCMCKGTHCVVCAIERNVGNWRRMRFALVHAEIAGDRVHVTCAVCCNDAIACAAVSHSLLRQPVSACTHTQSEHFPLRPARFLSPLAPLCARSHPLQTCAYQHIACAAHSERTCR